MSDYSSPRVCEVLLVEDNPADARLTQEALGEGRMLNRLHHVKDGIEALQFLRREAPYEDAPAPDVILLDLNLPRKDGRQVLSEMKQDPQLRLIPVVVLTTSEAERDIIKSYELHANCYITKPVDLEKFIYIVRTIEAFWLAVVTLPHRRSELSGSAPA
ncbi:MAG TPA: response regulator [Stellaceae bacterium]|nr:response regulator [Stellaceae bacterium]